MGSLSKRIRTVNMPGQLTLQDAIDEMNHQNELRKEEQRIALLEQAERHEREAERIKLEKKVRKELRMFSHKELNKVYSELRTTDMIPERDRNIVEGTCTDKDAYETAFLNVLYVVHGVYKTVCKKSKLNVLPSVFEREYDLMAERIQNI